jgi:hypothetical protein
MAAGFLRANLGIVEKARKGLLNAWMTFSHPVQMDFLFVYSCWQSNQSFEISNVPSPSPVLFLGVSSVQNGQLDG